MEEFKTMLSNWQNVKDRTTVRGFWMAFLFVIIANMAVGFVVGIISAIGVTILTALVGLVAFAVYIVLLVPLATCMVRRMNDIGKTWHYALLYFVPCVGWAIAIYFAIQPSIPADGRAVI